MGRDGAAGRESGAVLHAPASNERIPLPTGPVSRRAAVVVDEPLVALNTRIPLSLDREVALAVIRPPERSARRTKQEMVTEALQMYLAVNEVILEAAAQVPDGDRQELVTAAVRSYLAQYAPPETADRAS